MENTTSQQKSKVASQLRFALGLLAVTAGIWGFIPMVLGVVWLVQHTLFGGFGGVKQSFELFLNTFFYWGGAGIWAYTTITLIVALLAVFFIESEDNDARSERISKVFASVLVAALLGSLFQFVHLTWNSDKNVAKFYDSALVVKTPSVANPPASLQYLLNNVKHDPSGRCVYVNNADVPVCVQQGSLPLAGFEARVSSSAGALLVMQRTSGTRQKVNLLNNTLTYLNGQGKNGVWSAIRDGSGSFQPTEGVVEWSGTGLPTECTFGATGDRFSMALNGTKKNSLVNYLADLYPSLYYNNGDVWGYCQGAKPVLVFPVQRQTQYLSNVLSVPAGVLIVTGSTSGTPRVTYEANATNLPGPVYPKSVAATQRQMINWAAGRAKRSRGLFGFEPTNSSAQAGNVSEYLLKSKSDGHLYWVTPLTLANSQSQLFVAYSLVRADQVSAGHLNTMTLYTLASSDPREINVDQLEAAAKNYMVNNAGGFIPSGGSLIEFTPAVGDTWRAFGELNGRVIWRLDISANTSETPTLVNLDSSSPTTPTGTTVPNKDCGLPQSDLSQTQIITCAKFFVNLVG